MAESIITFLEMNSPSQLRKKPAPAGACVEMVSKPSPEINFRFYRDVGNEYQWIDRLTWTHEQWLEYLNQPGVETWILKANDVEAGYFELMPDSNGTYDIKYFGLLPTFTGRGLGAYLLSFAVERAWLAGAKRVTVNTCTLDHPAALANYEARGFQIIAVKSASNTT